MRTTELARVQQLAAPAAAGLHDRRAVQEAPDLQHRVGFQAHPGARVRGDMQAESVSLEEGAEFVGRLDAAFELPPELGGAGGEARRAGRR